VVFFVIVGVVDADVEHHAAEQFSHLGPAQRQRGHTAPPQQLGQLRVAQTAISRRWSARTGSPAVTLFTRVWICATSASSGSGPKRRGMSWSFDTDTPQRAKSRIARNVQVLHQ